MKNGDNDILLRFLGETLHPVVPSLVNTAVSLGIDLLHWAQRVNFVIELEIRNALKERPEQPHSGRVVINNTQSGLILPSTMGSISTGHETMTLFHLG